jgi:hypothetical protein
MITFHSRQSDCARHVRKNENADTFKFVSQIASSICTVTFTKHVKPDVAIFKSRSSRTVVCYRFDRVEALPLNFVRFLRLAIRSPMIQRSPARRSRNDREPSDKKSGELSRSRPHYFPAMAGQWQTRCRRISARVTRETTRNMARNARTAVRATDNAITSETSRKMARRNFVVTLSTMPSQNYEHTNCVNTQP